MPKPRSFKSEHHVLTLSLAVVTSLLGCSQSRSSSPPVAATAEDPATAPDRDVVDRDVAAPVKATPVAVSEGDDPQPSEESPSAPDAGASVRPPQESPPPPARQVEVICRDAWGAGPPVKEYVRHRISKLTIHHSGVRFTNSRKAPGRMTIMQGFHQGPAKGFADVAYHFVIDPAGNIYEGRPTWAAGETKTDYDPRTHLLVCVLGNYEEQMLGDVQLAALVDLLAWAAGEFNVAPSTIEGHRDHAHTDCPGKNIHELILDGTIRRRVVETLAAGGVEKIDLCGPVAERRIEAIKAGTRSRNLAENPQES